MTKIAGKHEVERLELERQGKEPWKKWGPYLSERQWGTVREDYSDNGDAWNYFSHDQARSRAYRWGEDGLAGISDDHQVLCFSLALWNGQDPILKERLFGLTNSEGNHGEDVKEYYFYLDSTPSHSYMKYLYKYPHQAFPYNQLVENNRGRSRQEPEYELLDTKVFDDNQYFDIFIEYAKSGPNDILVKITAENRGSNDAPLHILPTLLFRNTWDHNKHSKKPTLTKLSHKKYSVIHAHHPDPLFQRTLPDYYLYCHGLSSQEEQKKEEQKKEEQKKEQPQQVPLLFCENDTNHERLYGNPNRTPFVKDGINNLVVNGQDTCNPEMVGTKVSAHYQYTVLAGGSKTVMLRLSNLAPDIIKEPFADFEQVFQRRLEEANQFYEAMYTPNMVANPELAKVFRQALSGMLWSKQYFYYDLDRWLADHHKHSRVRNSEWRHMYSDDIISMPDKWEYPWYAAWDLAFHTVPLGSVDPDFSKQQLDLMLRNDYQHPNGQLPAYEWNFSDVNPPVHAFATIEIYQDDKARNNGKGDIDFLKYAFTKLLVNYSWWINRKDPSGKNVFQGGFLGLDNIGVFDRSSPLPTGGSLEQADGTSWMVFFSQQMLRIAIEIAGHDHLYEDIAERFLQHTIWIAGAMDRPGEHRDELWDEEDGFFYDVLRLPGAKSQRLKVRSMVGLLPLTAVCVIEESVLEKLPTFCKRSNDFTKRHPELCANIHLPSKPGVVGRRMLSVVNQAKLRRILSRMLDEKEFLSPHGIRSLSLYHKDHPFIFEHDGHEFRVDYIPGESDNGMFGGNSNWRGPIWMPVNFLLVKSLYLYFAYYGESFKVECPTGSGQFMNLLEVAQEISRRLYSIFLPGPDGRRPANGDREKFQTDPHWKDHILFYEYFHAESGTGLGASHQTGWTGLVARLLRLEELITPELLLSPGAARKANAALMAHWTDSE